MEIGKYNTLRIARRVDFGLYLADADGNEVLLPTRYVPDGCLGDAATAGRALSAGTRVAVRRGAPTAPYWQAPAGTRIVDRTNRPGKQQDRQQAPGSCTFILGPWPDR